MCSRLGARDHLLNPVLVLDCFFFSILKDYPYSVNNLPSEEMTERQNGNGEDRLWRSERKQRDGSQIFRALFAGCFTPQLVLKLWVISAFPNLISEGNTEWNMRLDVREVDHLKCTAL